MAWFDFSRRFIQPARARQRSRDRMRLYGFEPVNAPAARAIFSDFAAPDLEAAGFAIHKDRRFVREISPDLRQLIALYPLKPKVYGFQWGVSLSFVPHDWKRKPQWHRTLNSARPDLFCLVMDGPVVDGHHGEIPFREDMARLWPEWKAMALTWLDRAVSVGAVAALAEGQRQDRRASMIHFPPPNLVLAFCLARLGRAAEGRALLDEILAGDRQSLEPAANLRAAFEKIASEQAS